MIHIRLLEWTIHILDIRNVNQIESDYCAEERYKFARVGTEHHWVASSGLMSDSNQQQQQQQAGWWNQTVLSPTDRRATAGLRWRCIEQLGRELLRLRVTIGNGADQPGWPHRPNSTIVWPRVWQVIDGEKREGVGVLVTGRTTRHVGESGVRDGADWRDSN